MRRSAVTLARALAYIEFADLMTGAKAPAGELVRKLVERYDFQSFPKAFEDLDPSKGIKFEAGVAGDVPIRALNVYDVALSVDTRIHTNASMAIIDDILSWGAKEFGLNYISGSIKRFAFVSDVTFFSDVRILDVNPAVSHLAKRCTEEVTKIWQEPIKYVPITVRVGHDPTTRKFTIAPFLIEHRVESRFADNKYFSEAPLPTDTHWELLEQLEREMAALA